MSSKKRVGLYCWAGPGTIRMLRTKFFSPRMDTASVMSSYDLPYLRKVKETFGITDCWVTYSWGFGDDVERPDREFILSRLKHFRLLGLRTHAYIQGPNVVTRDFREHDWFCRDERGDTVPYSRGRRVVCVNNPGFRSYVADKVARACRHGFDGIFVDNIQMGKLGLPGGESHATAFVGCHCPHCQRKFHERYGSAMPTVLRPGSAGRRAVLGFRTDCTSEFVAMLAGIAHTHGKEFGTNSYDPRFDPSYCYGTDLRRLAGVQDYLLFENHSLPDRKNRRNNQYIERIIEDLDLDPEKPVFIVSYKYGIGFEREFSQHDMDLIFSEAVRSRFSVCLKGSEYRTRKVWHNLRPEQYRRPVLLPFRFIHRHRRRRRSVFTYSGLNYLFRRFGNRTVAAYMESRVIRGLLDPAYRSLLRKK